MTEREPVASLGAGVIGASWTSLFLARGHTVQVYDPASGAADTLKRYIAQAWPTLEALDAVVEGADPDAFRLTASAAEAVSGVTFVQESVPERVVLKHDVYAQIEPALAPGTVVASSASGLMLTELQAGWKDPAPLILGHPFNPPHLIPLVELLGNDRTAPDAIDRAEAFYEGLGKITIRLNKEVPGHVANRLQAAVWREAVHLAQSGVASIGDIDRAMWSGPGVRWAAMGPTTLFHIAAGEGGLASFCERYTPSFNRWWDDLGAPHLDPALAANLSDGIAQSTEDAPVDEIAEKRDALIIAMLKATRHLDRV